MTNQELIREAIDKGPQPIYKLFDNERVATVLSKVTLENTPFHGELSNKSLRILCRNKHKGDDLADIFGLDRYVFKQKYHDAVSGDGQEARRIRTIHSSSLISLLCFYWVSETRPLSLDLDGRAVTFTKSAFEVKNDIAGSIHPSNIDVVLFGKELVTGKPTVLFLESKFSEYLNWGRYSGISNDVYEDTYKQLSSGRYLDRMGLKYIVSAKDHSCSDLSSINGRTYHYAAGIKQMVSHYLGVKTVIETGLYKDADVYLGEILYVFPESIDPDHKKIKDYTKLYDVLAQGLNDLSESKFKIVHHCFTYQGVFKNNKLDAKVRDFYSL
jgi:hypothetical protein